MTGIDPNLQILATAGFALVSFILGAITQAKIMNNILRKAGMNPDDSASQDDLLSLIPALIVGAVAAFATGWFTHQQWWYGLVSVVLTVPGIALIMLVLRLVIRAFALMIRVAAGTKVNPSRPRSGTEKSAVVGEQLANYFAIMPRFATKHGDLIVKYQSCGTTMDGTAEKGRILVYFRDEAQLKLAVASGEFPASFNGTHKIVLCLASDPPPPEA